MDIISISDGVFEFTCLLVKKIVLSLICCSLLMLGGPLGVVSTLLQILPSNLHRFQCGTTIATGNVIRSITFWYRLVNRNYFIIWDELLETIFEFFANMFVVLYAIGELSFIYYAYKSK